MKRNDPVNVVVIVVPDAGLARQALLDSGDFVPYDANLVESKEEPNNMVRFVPFKVEA